MLSRISQGDPVSYKIDQGENPYPPEVAELPQLDVVLFRLLPEIVEGFDEPYRQEDEHRDYQVLFEAAGLGDLGRYNFFLGRRSAHL